MRLCIISAWRRKFSATKTATPPLKKFGKATEQTVAVASAALPNVRWLYAAVAFVFVVSMLRGITYPSTWTYTHFVFDYDFGLTRRGLLGAFFGWWDVPFLRSYRFFLIFSAAIFAANVWLIGGIFKQLIDRRQPFFVGCALVFASSPAVVYFSNSIGYADHIGLLLVLLSFRLRGFEKKLFYFFVTVPLVLLIHEAFLLIFFPAAFMTLLLSVSKKTPRQTRQLHLLIGFAVLILLWTAVVSQWGRFGAEKTAALLKIYSAEVDFALFAPAFSYVYQMDMADNFRLRMAMLTDNGINDYRAMLSSWLVTAPTLFFFIVLMLRAAAHMPLRQKILLVLTPLSAQLLHIVGFDIHRWNTLSITVSFLMFFYVACGDGQRKKMPPSSPLLFAHWWLAVAVLIFLNSVSDLQLLGGQHILSFPFAEHKNYLVRLLSGDIRLPVRPPY